MAPTVHEVTVNSFTMVPPMIRVGVCAGDEIRVTHAGAASEAHVLCMVEPSARRRCAAIRHGETASFAVSELAAGSGELFLYDMHFDFMTCRVMVSGGGGEPGSAPLAAAEETKGDDSLAHGSAVQPSDSRFTDSFVYAAANNQLLVVRRRLGLEQDAPDAPMRQKLRITDVDVEDSDGMTALRAASASGHVEVIRQLVAAGANVDGFGRDGNTALHHASIWGHVAAARLLLDTGSTRTVFARNEQLQTPMHSATLNGHIGVVEALLERWPDPNMMDFSGKTCVDVALSFGRSRLQISELLFEYQGRWSRRLMHQCLLLFSAGSSAMRELVQPDTLRLITEFITATAPEQLATLERVRST